AGPTFEQKMAWMLRLEDHRVLRDPAPAIPPVAAPPPVRGRKAQPPAVEAPPPPPDLVRLLADAEPRVRRRAALAIGRVGLGEGAPPLIALLADNDPEVRQMAAFALGLIGDTRARDPLVTALGDQSPLVQGSAAEALGLIGDAGAADAIGRMVSQIVQGGSLVQPPGDDADAPRDTPAAAFRLGVFALVRLKAYDQLAGAVLDESGQPRVRWWPVAYAFQRLADKRALSALLSLAKDSNPYARAFAVKGLGALKDPAAMPVLTTLLGVLSPDTGLPRLLSMLSDADQRAMPSVLAALVKLRAPDAASILLDRLKADDPVVRVAAAAGIGELKPPDGAPALADA